LEAIYGTKTGTYESVTSAAASATDAAYAKVSSVIYGEEQSALESAKSRLNAAVENARVKLGEYGEGAGEFVKQASEGVEGFASSVSSVVGKATSSAKDEL
jgi:hypothetical protein